MKILIACEFSGIVRDAFRAEGHDAWSCDLEPSERPGPHYQGDVRDIISQPWDMLIAFPPCTHLCASGARWWASRQAQQEEALALVRVLLDQWHIPRIALENPTGRISTAIRRPDQIIQPWQHGHGETKSTCLWLKGLPILQPSRLVAGREQRIHRMPARASRSRERSRTYPGIAAAMAAQWGKS